MKPFLEALKLQTIEELEIEIRLRSELRAQMVGTLYPQMLTAEIQDLNECIADIEIQKLAEANILKACESEDEPKTSIIVLDSNKLRYISEQIEKPNFNVESFYKNGYWNVFIYSVEFEQYLTKHEINFYCQTDMERYKSECPTK